MPVGARKRVLVVDDEPSILHIIKIALGIAGYDIVTTTNGEAALQLVQTQTFDIMLLDILMLPLTGFDVLKKLRSSHKSP